LKEDIFKGYVKRSFYIEQIERYLQYFSLNQMHFIIFEEMIKDQNAELNRLSEFLGIEHQEMKRDILSNITYLPKSRNIEYLSRKLFSDSLIYKVIHKLNQKSSDGYPPINESTRKYLADYFAPYNRQLQELLGIDILRYWNK
jgi:hypothetical protein